MALDIGQRGLLYHYNDNDSQLRLKAKVIKI